MRTLTGLIVFLAWPAAIYADDPTACATGTLTQRIACVEASRGTIPQTGKTVPLLKTWCRAQRQWRDYRDASIAAGETGASAALEEVLKQLVDACKQETSLRLGNEMLAQGRYTEAIKFYEEVPKLHDARAVVPELSEWASRGHTQALRAQNTLVLPPRAIVALENRGQFEEAYSAMTQIRPDTDAHRTNLARLLQFIRDRGRFEQRHDFDGAQKAAFDLLAKLDPVRDRVLADYVHTQAVHLQDRAAETGNREADLLIAAGDLQMARGNFDKAVEIYDKVTASRRASPAVIEAATAKAAEARKKAAQEPTWSGTWLAFWASIFPTLVHVIGWIPYILAYAVLVLVPLVLIVLIFKVIPARKEISLAMEDHTSLPSAPSNAAAGEEMRREMALPLTEFTGPRVEAADDSGGSSLGQLRLAVPLRAIETAFTTTAPFAFGPLTINPLELYRLFRQFARRRCRYELTGSLRANGADTACTVRVVRKPLRVRLSRASWEAIGSGSDARAQAIRAVAMQVLIDIDPNAFAITREWRSLRALRDGLAELEKQGGDAASRRARYQRARASFQEAVLADPGNWLARFNLGTVLGKLDLNPPAAEQFRELIRSRRLPADYMCAVKYNLAVALQKTDDEKLAIEALSVLEEVIQHNESDSTLGRLARSGVIATWADRLTRQRARLDHAHPTREALAEFNEKVRTWTTRATEALAEMDNVIATEEDGGEENNVVIAVLLNAVGELIALSAQPNRARDCYRRSLTLLPSFFEPYLNLAALYIRRKRSLDAHWATNAERLLLEVQSNDAGNSRSMLLLGDLYAQPIFGRIEDAKTQLARALPDPRAARRLGSLLLAQHDATGAVAPLASAVSQEPRDGISNFLMALCALALPDTDRRRCGLLEAAERWLTEQLNAGTGNRFQRTLARVQAARSGCALRQREPPSLEEEPAQGESAAA